MSARKERVGIVIPVGPATGHLGEQLAAVRGQRFDGLIDLVLSCNGSDPHWVGQLAGRDWPDGWTVTVLDSSAVRGPSHARNDGWRSTTAPKVLFCDADDVIAADWTSAMAAQLERAQLVGGVIEYDSLNAPGLGTWGTVGTKDLPRKFSHLPFVPSGNLGALRTVLEDLNGFDESLDRSEDVDFSWRAQYVGSRIALASDAVLSCRRRDRLDALFAQAWDDASHDLPLLLAHAPRGARWRIRDLFREAAGVAVALIQAPFARGYRSELSTRSGRFLGHLILAPRMLTARRRNSATTGA